MEHKILRAVTCICLIMVICLNALSDNAPLPVTAAMNDPLVSTPNDLQDALRKASLRSKPKTIYLSEVKKLAVSKSAQYKTTKVKIITKKANYTDAIARIAAKKKKLSTLSWMPLLSFNFPTDPSFTEEFEFNFKPISIQSEITDLQHKLNDDLYSIYEKATNLYVKVYTLQETIAFNRNLLASKQKTLEKNEGRLLLGLATQTDVDAIKKSIKKLEDQISTDETTFMNNKEKLQKMIGVDVRSGYRFVNPYQNALIERADLASITDYTIEKSQSMFEAKSNTQLARVTLDQYYKQMVAKYGSHMSRVKSYVEAAKNGEEIDGLSLKEAFDQLLKDIDKKWEGKLKILFIKVPKLWFKGATAGSRYIEDEPYALYNAILDYQSARLEQQGTEAEIRAEVKDAFENVKALEKTYRSGVEDIDVKKRELEQALVKNQLGQLPFDEYTALQEDFENTQLTVSNDLDAYTQALVSLDRLTCGAITVLLSGDGINAAETVGGDSYLIAETAEGVNYYIKVMQEADVFELGLHIPEDFEVDLSKFELWVDNTKVGSAEVNNTIKHLGMVLDGSETVFLRFFDGNEEMICDYTIDPSVYSGHVDIITGYVVKKKEDTVKTIGTYTLKENEAGGTVKFVFTADDSVEGAASYKLMTSNGSVLGGKETANGQELTYLTLLQGSIDSITVAVFDSNGEQIVAGKPDPDTMTVKTVPEGGEAQ
ncbi:MAG: TolC family protein [Lachnospiraceae bacterium]|nr:TolC family protein [Lachnospiraceae bacterium]